MPACGVAGERGRRKDSVDGGVVAASERTSCRPPVLESAGAECGFICGALVLGVGVAVGGEVSSDLPDFRCRRVAQPSRRHATALGLENGKEATVEKKVFRCAVQIDIEGLGAEGGRVCGGGPLLDTLVDFRKAGLRLRVACEGGE